MAQFAHFDALGEPGLTTRPHLPAIDTLTGDAGGWRSALARFDMTLETEMVTSIMDNVLSTGQPRDPQRYNGQRFTLQTYSTNTTLTAGLDRFGLTHAKFLFGLSASFNNYHQGNGDNTAGIRLLAYYQSFANKSIELKAGWMPNYYEYVGLFLGGSPQLSGGISSIIPIQAGLSADPVASTPAVNLTFNAASGLYTKVGLQRSTSPLGGAYEAQHNGIGLKTSQRGAGLLAIGELGIKREATADQHQVWLRGGYLYNDSDYTAFATGKTQHNESAYVAGDYQISQVNTSMPFRGVYGGVSAFWAPSDVNVYTQNAEARLYAIGLFDSRPIDTITLRAAYTRFSGDAARAVRAQGEYANRDQTSISAGYSYHAFKGVYLIPNLAVIEHPSFLGDFDRALVLSTTLYMGF